MRYPEHLLTEDEEIVHEFRPHWKILLPALGWAMLLMAATGVAFAALPFETARWALLAAPLLWLLIAGRSALDYWFTQYVLTTERIIVRTGILSRSGTEIPLESIVNVLFSQTFVERLLRYGDVTLESAGVQGRSVLEDVPGPEGLQSQVYRLREARSWAMRRGPEHGDPAEPPAGDVISELERLASLRERGHLSDDEFETRKRRLLADD